MLLLLLGPSQWTVPGFDCLPERTYSPVFGPAYAPWRLLLFPRGNATHQAVGQQPTHLSL